MATEDWMSLAEPNAEWAAVSFLLLSRQHGQNMNDPDANIAKYVKQLGGMLDLGNFDDIPSMREFFNGMKAQMVAALGPPNPNVHEEDKHVKARDGAEIRLRIYSPKKAPANGSPLAFIIHGGGFCIGEPENETVLVRYRYLDRPGYSSGMRLTWMQCRRLSDDLGFVCVSVDYRLAPEHPFPVPVNDCFDALHWVRVAFYRLARHGY